jgi:methylated-DNA-[protein]-cysteine S-methyltransferase
MKMKQPGAVPASSRIRLETPVGTLVFEARNNAVNSIHLATEEDAAVPYSAPEGSALYIAARQIEEYFEGKRASFSFPMQAEGTSFQHQVWQALNTIPYGETRTYGDIALLVGNPKGARAVGGACNKNPLWIAVPCHRVLGAGGSLTGYAYGTGMKQTLLKLEQSNKK